MLFSDIQNYIQETILSFDSIPNERKKILSTISQFVADRAKSKQKAELIYICTHNSRRSHFGQIWGKVAAYYYGIENVFTYSGGTEATAFNPNAIKAIQNVGILINSDENYPNPHYTLFFNDEKTEIECFSKVYDASSNPQEGFLAVMTCTHADEHCPFVAGASTRVATPYEDPKKFDNTPEQDIKYNERCRQIALESLYTFSLAKSLLN